MIYIPMPAFWEHLVLQPLPYYCNETSQESPFYLTVTSPALPSCCLPPLPLHHRSPLRQNFLLSAGWRMPPVPCWALHKCAPAATAVRHRNKTNTTLCIIEFSKIFPPGAISGQMCFSTKCRYFQNILDYSAIMRKKTYLSVSTGPSVRSWNWPFESFYNLKGWVWYGCPLPSSSLMLLSLQDGFVFP